MGISFDLLNSLLIDYEYRYEGKCNCVKRGIWRGRISEFVVKERVEEIVMCIVWVCF